jgi:hypothetical protein
MQADKEPTESNPVYRDIVSSTHSLSLDLIGAHVSHTNGALDFQSGVSGMPFAGSIVRNAEGQPVGDMGACLGPLTVPMYAPFMKPFSDDWITTMKKAIEYCKSSERQLATDDRCFILVPIDSPGGSVDELKRMLAVLDEARAIGKTMRTDHNNSRFYPHNPIEVITYANGMVASCAFVLFQHGDICLSGPTTDFLCHEPAVVRPASDSKQTMYSDKSAQLGLDLLTLKQDIYDRSELAFLMRYSRKFNKQNQPDTRLVSGQVDTESVRNMWRQKWYKENLVYIQWFSKENAIRLKRSVNDLKPLAPEENIFEYITSDIAEDPHSKILHNKWMHLFGFADSVGVHIETMCTRSIQIKQTKRFVSNLAHNITQCAKQ